MILGVFVGGQSRRMGGRPKGLLSRPDGQLILIHLIGLGRELGLETVLVGDPAPYRTVVPTIRALEDLRVDDSPPGPMGGLAAVLLHARQQEALVVACDQPFLTAEVLNRFIQAPRLGPVAASRALPDAPWDPFPSRWGVAAATGVTRALAARVRSWQEVFRDLDVCEVALSSAERRLIRDWDSPSDIPTAPAP